MTVSTRERDEGTVDRLVREVATRFGLSTRNAVVLDRGMNLVVHLRPAPVVARVTRVSHRVRPIEALVGAVALSRSLGQIVVSPSTVVDPGPHLADGHYVTFWEYTKAEAADPVQAGGSLQRLHEAAGSYRGELRHFDPRTDARIISVLIGGEEGEILGEAAERLQMPVLREQAIHGDAHLANVVRGGRWLDPDEMCRGPLEWDLACLAHRSSFWGEVKAETDAALRAYGPHDEDALRALAPLVVLFTAAWGSLAPLLGEPIGARTRRRLEWLRTESSRAQ